MKRLPTIRLDPSDTFVFEQAAEPGEWAVSGAFAFWHADPDMLFGKARAAFRAVFLGLSSLGRSTLVQIVEASEEDRAAAVDLLARQLVARFGAPSLEQARAAAEEEIAFAASLCSEPQDTLIAVHRSHENGELREAFRTLRRRAGSTMRVFEFPEVLGDEPEESVDLATLAREKGE